MSTVGMRRTFRQAALAAAMTDLCSSTPTPMPAAPAVQGQTDGAGASAGRDQKQA